MVTPPPPPPPPSLNSDCPCCKGFIYKCSDEICAGLGVCMCSADDEYGGAYEAAEGRNVVVEEDDFHPDEDAPGVGHYNPAPQTTQGGQQQDSPSQAQMQAAITAMFASMQQQQQQGGGGWGGFGGHAGSGGSNQHHANLFDPSAAWGQIPPTQDAWQPQPSAAASSADALNRANLAAAEAYRSNMSNMSANATDFKPFVGSTGAKLAQAVPLEKAPQRNRATPASSQHHQLRERDLERERPLPREGQRQGGIIHVTPPARSHANNVKQQSALVKQQPALVPVKMSDTEGGARRAAAKFAGASESAAGGGGGGGGGGGVAGGGTNTGGATSGSSAANTTARELRSAPGAGAAGATASANLVNVAVLAANAVAAAVAQDAGGPPVITKAAARKAAEIALKAANLARMMADLDAKAPQ